MFLVSGVFSFAIWQKMAKITRFHTCEMKYVQGSLTVLLDFAQKFTTQKYLMHHVAFPYYFHSSVSLQTHQTSQRVQRW